MKTKNTYEYALLCAKLESNQLDQELTPLELTLFATGYMKAIEETAAPELLNALIYALENCTTNLSNTIELPREFKSMAQAAIKKAIGE